LFAPSSYEALLRTPSIGANNDG